jgi:glycosyltransferase involved in cell wall biosynthesis
LLPLSIITINYNNAAGLRKTIESVISQSFKDIEYIIIDGGSTDGSKELIEKYAESITYWVSEKDNGIYPAMNKGIQVANGEYLLFLNSGDWFYENTTLSMAIPLLRPFDIVYGNTMNFKSDGTTWLQNPPAELSLYSLGYRWNSLPHQAMFTKRNLFEKYGGYDENLKMVADWAFYLIAIFKHNCSYKRIDNIIAWYYFEGFSANINNEPLQKAERALVLEQHFKNHIGLMKEAEQLNAQLDYYKQSRLLKVLKKMGILE